MNKKNIYFDIAATTPTDPLVLKRMNEIDGDYYGNPSSVHFFGQKSHNLVERCRKEIAIDLGCEPSEIFFTSGGTESNNIALKGILKKGDHLITSSYEHPSILNVAKKIEKEGIEVSFIKPNENGIIELDDIKNEIKDNTKLISIMFLNNELGSINPIKDIRIFCKDHKILFHTDAVQFIGKGNFDFKEYGIDLLSIGAHKFYGPKGIGALIVKKGIAIEPIIQGGSQESGLRAGTESPSLIAGMTKALKIANENLDKNIKHIKELEKTFIDELSNTNIHYIINGNPRLHGFINITFKGFDGQTLLMNLDLNGIAISFGSACSSGSAKASMALLETGMQKNDAKNTVRITFGKFNTKEEVKYLVQILKKVIYPTMAKDTIHV